MKSKYFLIALVLVLAMTAGCTTAEKASTASNDYDVTPQSTANVQETIAAPTDSTILDNDENVKSENGEEELQSSALESNVDSEEESQSSALEFNVDSEEESQSSASESNDDSTAELLSSNSKSDSDSMDISADWAENVTDTVTDYDEYIIDNSDYAMSIMFTANNPVSDFKIVSLQYEDVKEDGTPVFLTEDVYTYGELTTEQSLLVKLSFPGDMPNYGVSYTDSSGTEKHYALQQSGKDGSLVMFEFE